MTDLSEMHHKMMHQGSHAHFHSVPPGNKSLIFLILPLIPLSLASDVNTVCKKRVHYAVKVLVIHTKSSQQNLQRLSINLQNQLHWAILHNCVYFHINTRCKGQWYQWHDYKINDLWQSRVEIEHYSVAYFIRINAF